MRRASLLVLAGIVALLASAGASPAEAQGLLLTQGPSGDWRTVTTEHYRLHYPAPSEAWARYAAARLESIHERVVQEVGYDPPEVVDVLVSDPVASANGMAYPFLGWPRMVLWTSPPGPESAIGHYLDWPELLIVHEATHLVHLLRPSRNPAWQRLTRLVPAGPITLGAPRWVTEGYATLVEGRLTGSGRPHSDLRAAMLRRWAQGGKLPSYGQLANDSRSWQGMSMAYLLGSAYLEWLEERAGPGSLRNLWARMTARRARGFGEAFRGVFGDSPANLYDRFRAELTWRALEVERRRGERGDPAAGELKGELWQDLSWTTGAPAVSPDGEKLAIVLDSRDDPARLVVWSTGPNTDAEEEHREEQEEILARDPEDVPAVRDRPLPREPLHTLETRNGIEPTTPRWLRDGRSILFVRFEPDGEGFIHPDLFLWAPEDGDVRRVTRAADVRDPDPAPDGTWAVAVRNRHGLSQLVRVDLRTGAVDGLTEPAVDVIYDRPRLSPDGRRLAVVRHRQGAGQRAWRVVVRELESGAEAELAPPGGGTLSSPAWSADGRTVYAVVGSGGFIDVWALPVASSGESGRAPVRLTRTRGAALDPAPTPDGSGLFYLSLEPDGLDLYRLDLAAAPAAAADLPALPATELAPAIPPPPAAPPAPFSLAEVPAGRPYGIGRQEISTHLGGSSTSSGSSLELGVRGGDLVGRLGYLVFGSLSSDGWPEGGAVAVAWRGWPVTVGLHAFVAEERPSEQADEWPRSPDSLALIDTRVLDMDRQGVELSAGWERLWSGWSQNRLALDGRLLAGDVDPAAGPSLSQEIGALSAALSGRTARGQWRLLHGAALHYEEGRTGGDGWSRYGGGLRLGLGYDDTALRVTWRRDGSSDLRRGFDLYQLGGAASSLLPESVLSGRIAVPALPVGTFLGEEHEGQRAELALGFLPGPLFYERHRLWFGASGDNRPDEWLSLAGLEWQWSIDPIPLGRIPALDVRAGVARILDAGLEGAGERLEGDTRWWLTAVWRP